MKDKVKQSINKISFINAIVEKVTYYNALKVRIDIMVFTIMQEIYIKPGDFVKHI